MKIERLRQALGLGICLGLLGGCPCFGQVPPPNDNISNSIVLTGADVTFGGTLAGASVEGDWEGEVLYDTYVTTQSTESIWWKWTAPTNTALTIQILSTSLEPSPANNDSPDGLAIYSATNDPASPADLAQPQLGFQMLYLSLFPQTLSIPVSAGSNYYIQLIGSSSANYTFRLTATNTPVIIQHPRSQTVSSNDCALFYVVSAGTTQPAFSFQWLFNGTNIPGQTAPMLALTNIDSTMAGAYSVIVSNDAGFTVSQPATLAISQSNTPISLSVMGVRSNSLVFALAGESGRNYRIQSSTDLAYWADEESYPFNPYASNTTSVIFNSNSPTVLGASNNAPQKFFRATPYVINDPRAAICVNNLERIRIAKLLWARDFNQINYIPGDPYPELLVPWETPSGSELIAYFPGRVGVVCPDDPYQEFYTSYDFRETMQEPVCDINPAAHVMEAPR